MSCDRKTVDVFFTGKRRRNRVRLRLYDDGTLRMEWREDGEDRYDWLWHGALTEDAKERARKKARELDPGVHTHKPPSELMAIRADLLRVAELQGVETGVAPGRDFYREHGRYCESTVQAGFAGYESGGRKPKDSWSDAMKRYGLTAASRAAHTAYYDLVQDIYRVARELGAPHRMPGQLEYIKRGNHGAAHIVKRAGCTWVELADKIGLEVEDYRREKSRKLRGNSLAENHHSEAA